ncbi:hypothetical protein PVAND_002294 [Polypedilum vanderplanki]|uniref:Uncharacterized protein n=1 Tax=Polypedilum vanderplanki TaxID=319348 RepID=A0A9J6BQJ6_POLVA|nr:hypothetical protein PVAND_002294 [Polypedilum vanderplanki]
MSTNSESYDAVDSLPNSQLDNIKNLLHLFNGILYATVASIPIFFKWLFHLFLPPPLKNISGQLALITGSSAGIGRAIAMRLAREGCHIAIVNRNLKMGQKVAEEIRAQYKVKAIAFEADVSKCEDVKRLKREVEESLGNVDILVNNAGLLSLENSLLEGNDEDYQRVVDVNLTSYFWTTRAFLPGMMERKKGHIVSVSSLITKISVFGTIAYTTTKYGNIGFMEALNEDLKFFGYSDCIKTTTVLPTLVGTQRKHSQMVEAISKIPVSNVYAIAKDIVYGMQRNRRIFSVPQSAGLVGIFSWFPDDACFLGKLKLMDKSKLDEFMKIRAKK